MAPRRSFSPWPRRAHRLLQPASEAGVARNTARNRGTICPSHGCLGVCRPLLQRSCIWTDTVRDAASRTARKAITTYQAARASGATESPVVQSATSDHHSSHHQRTSFPTSLPPLLPPAFFFSIFLTASFRDG